MLRAPSLAIAAAIASHSRHPYSRALRAAFGAGASASLVPDRHRTSGSGPRSPGRRDPRTGWDARNGRSPGRAPESAAVASVVLSKDGRFIAAFDFEDRLRPDARAAVEALARGGLPAAILSGDREAPVRTLAAALGIPHAARVSPGGKNRAHRDLVGKGCKPLMVGDGLNDAPALMAAHASMAPASAADVGRNAADLVFLRQSLMAVPQAIAIARNAARLVRENLILAVGYNVVAVPVAVMGYVTPLIAAIAMSLSSLIVVANALRLQEGRRERTGGAIEMASPYAADVHGECPMIDFFFLIPVALALGAVGPPHSYGRCAAVNTKTSMAPRSESYLRKRMLRRGLCQMIDKVCGAWRPSPMPVTPIISAAITAFNT